MLALKNVKPFGRPAQLITVKSVIGLQLAVITWLQGFISGDQVIWREDHINDLPWKTTTVTHHK